MCAWNNIRIGSNTDHPTLHHQCIASGEASSAFLTNGDTYFAALQMKSFLEESGKVGSAAQTELDVPGNGDTYFVA